jgi:hypothetical protein
MLALAVPRPSPFPHLPLAPFPSPPWRCVTYNEKHINQIDVLGIDWENPTRQSYVLFETLPSAGSYACYPYDIKTTVIIISSSYSPVPQVGHATKFHGI